MKRFTLFSPGKAAFASVAAVVLISSAVLLPSFATGDVVPTGVTDTVLIKGGKKGLRFVAPPTAHVGDTLQVINQTNPQKLGPHTFALVTPSSLPKTRHARKVCFTKGHICRAIAGWFGGNKLTENPTIAGGPGWDTAGSVSVKGDAWFTGGQPGTSVAQPLTASPGPLTFFCAIHPAMHGSIQVLPPGA